MDVVLQSTLVLSEQLFQVALAFVGFSKQAFSDNLLNVVGLYVNFDGEPGTQTVKFIRIELGIAVVLCQCLLSSSYDPYISTESTLEATYWPTSSRTKMTLS